MDYNHMKRQVSLELCFTLSLVLAFGSILLSPTVINVALANDMSDAPMTKNTITAGSDGDDKDKGDNDLEDAPVTQDTITAGGGSEGDDEDNSGQKGDNNDSSDNINEPTNTGIEVSNKPNCPKDQERALFETTCKPTNVESGECEKNDLDVWCQNLASQIQGDGSSAALPSEEATSQVNDCGNGDDPLPTWCQNLAPQIQGDDNSPALAASQGTTEQ
jgi:hypothetical protein